MSAGLRHHAFQRLWDIYCLCVYFDHGTVFRVVFNIWIPSDLGVLRLGIVIMSHLI